MKKINSNLTSIVEILSDEEIHDGTSIGSQLNITRTAVWKTIKKLENYGVPIVSIKGKGYSLVEQLILLDKSKILKLIKNKNIELSLFETIDSTNCYLKKSISGKKIKVCLAEQQTQGKGRFNRTWYSPFGQNIYLSLLYKFEKDISTLAGLSLIISLAIIETLASYDLVQAPLVKWPNDVVINNKKVAGNLVEVIAETNGVCHAIIGVGINVNMLDGKNSGITQEWTSIRKVNQNYFDRNILSATLIDNLIVYLEEFERHGLSYFLKKWKSSDCLYKKEIALKFGTKKILGTVQGINDQGHLQMQLSDGSIKYFSSGDTTIISSSQ
jgi:BirA family biotin operon repressor/biotin-[acetyl-CoA-carboxylase] ligase